MLLDVIWKESPVSVLHNLIPVIKLVRSEDFCHRWHLATSGKGESAPLRDGLRGSRTHTSLSFSAYSTTQNALAFPRSQLPDF